MPQKFLPVITSYTASEIGAEDVWHEVIAGCYEASKSVKGTKFYSTAREMIEQRLKRERRENSISYRALRLDKCYEDSKHAMIDWLRVPDNS